jgi:hypothetical protein
MERIDEASRVWGPKWLLANLSVNETKDACVFPSRPWPASRSNRPDTYQRPPQPTHNLYCETQPVHTLGQKRLPAADAECPLCLKTGHCLNRVLNKKPVEEATLASVMTTC